MDYVIKTKKTKEVTWVGLIINVLLSLFKLFVGIFGNSQALVADGIHSISDFVTDIAVLLGVRYWSKSPDAKHPYGHRRAETLVTFFIAITLIVVASGIVWRSVTTIRNSHIVSPSMTALYVALISIILKESLYRWTIRVGQKIKSMPLIANAWHHRSDALSSVPVLIAIGIAVYAPKWSFVDHIGAVIVSIFIYQAAYKIIRSTLSKLLDVSAPEEQLNQISDIATRTAGVKRVHKVRTRYLDGCSIAVDMHVEVAGDKTVSEGHAIAGKAKADIMREIDDIVDVIIHVDPAI